MNKAKSNLNSNEKVKSNGNSPNNKLLVGITNRSKTSSFVDLDFQLYKNKEDENNNCVKSKIGNLFKGKDKSSSKDKSPSTTPRIKNIKSVNSLNVKKSRSSSLGNNINKSKSSGYINNLKSDKSNGNL